MIVAYDYDHLSADGAWLSRCWLRLRVEQVEEQPVRAYEEHYDHTERWPSLVAYGWNSENRERLGLGLPEQR